MEQSAQFVPVVEPSPSAVMKIRHPRDIVALVPYVIGYRPADSIVVLGVVRHTSRLGPIVRSDIPETGDTDLLARQIAQTMVRNDVGRAFVVMSSTCHDGSMAMTTRFAHMLERIGVPVEHAMLTDGSRWWCCPSTACAGCTPRGGEAYDASAMAISASAVAAGMSFGHDRDALRRLFAATVPADHAVAAAITQAERLTHPGPRGRAREQAMTVAVGRCLDREGLDVDQVAYFAVGSSSIRVRDAAWSIMRRETASRHLKLWAEVVRRSPPAYVPGAGSLAAFAAWLGGNGTHARHAVERVLEVDPAYSMARLIDELLDSCINPRRWDPVRTTIAEHLADERVPTRVRPRAGGDDG